MSESIQQNGMLRLKPDVFIYRSGDCMVIVKRQLRAITIRSEGLYAKIDEVVKLLEHGAHWTDVARLAGIHDTSESAAVANALLQGKFVEAVEPAHKFAGLQGAGLFEVREIESALQRLTVQAAVPDGLWACLQPGLAAAGVRAERVKVEFDNGKALHLSLPPKGPAEDTFLILCMPCLDLPYIEPVAYRLFQENISYLPIYRETDASIVVGPIVTRGGPCLQCLQGRIAAILEYPQVIQLLLAAETKLVRRGHDYFDALEAQFVSPLVSTLVVKYVLGMHRLDGLRRRLYYRLRLSDPSIQQVAVYRNPRCGACGPDLFEPSSTAFQNISVAGDKVPDASASRQ